MIQLEQPLAVAETYGEAERQAAEVAAVRRMLQASQGCFSLGVAVCNSPAPRDELIGELRQTCPDIRVVAVPQETSDVFALALAEAGDPPPAAMFLVNLEASLPSDRADHPVLRSLNASRELWPKHFACPVVFWLPEYAAAILSTHARDFWRFRSHGFEFVSESMASPAMMEEVSQGDFLAATNLSAQGKRFRIAELEQRIREAGSPPPQSMLRHVAAWLGELGFLERVSGNPDRAMSIWQDSLSIHEHTGNVRGKATTLDKMAAVVGNQGDVARATLLWQESLRLSEQIGDVQGKAATLSNMAGVVAQQGDVARAMALWEESLSLSEQIGDVKGKVATFHNMAEVVAQQGDVPRAMALWQESLELVEQIGHMYGKAVVLANMAWIAGKQGDIARERELNLQAARALATVRAWLDLVTVLSNLGLSEGPDAVAFLAQAFWLCAHVQAPVQDVVHLSAAFVKSLGPGVDVAPLVAAYAVFIVETRGENHPKKEELTRLARGMLAACAEARGVPPEGFPKWLEAERLDDTEALVPALTQALEGLVGEHEWLFDRTLLSPSN